MVIEGIPFALHGFSNGFLAVAVVVVVANIMFRLASALAVFSLFFVLFEFLLLMVLLLLSESASVFSFYLSFPFFAVVFKLSYI